MNRHTFDPVSMVAGLVFAAVAALYLASEHSTFDIDGRWVLPLVLIGLGIGGVSGALTTAARQRREQTASAAGPDVSEPGGAGQDEQSESVAES
jgi:hypothetical protein